MTSISKSTSENSQKESKLVNSVELKPVSIDLGAGSIAGVTLGDDEKPIMLCLHGWLDNVASFYPLLPYLPDTYKIIAIEWPGHGHSDHRGKDAHYHFIDWVYDLLKLFESQKWKSVDIVAHSMGGMVASAFAAAFPEKVKSLTLIDSIGFVTAPENETTSQLKKGLESRLKNRTSNTKRHFELEAATNARVAVSDLSFAHAQLIVERSVVKIEPGCQWRSDPRLRNISPYRLSLLQAQQLIKDVKCPVQLIHGNKGMKMVSLGLKHFGALFNSLQEFELSGGHHVHMEQPKETAALICKFLAINF